MIKIITGRQSDPLQEKILEAAVKNYQQNPEKETFIIVPNHIKFTTEVNAINKLASFQEKSETSVNNLQVLSFSRLAWYYLKKTDQTSLQQLDDAAAAMLLSKIIENHKEEFQLLKDINLNSGLIKQIYNEILQIYEGNFDLNIESTTDLDTETQQKIHDLNIIYSDFIEQIKGQFATKNETQLQLNEILSEKADLSQASFFFCDFSHFSLQESLTIKLLFKKAENVTLAFKTRLGEINPKVEEGDYDFVIQKTISNLTSYLTKQEIDYQTESLPLPAKLSKRDELNGIWNGSLNSPEQLNQVQLVKADSRYSEAYFVARTIYQQVALSNYRYKDFLVLAPNLQEYQTYLTPILRQNGIPYFDDLQQEMKYHPLVVLIENLAKLVQYPLQTQYLLTLLKTHLLIPDWYHDLDSYIHDVDLLENFVLAHGINHNLWQQDFASFVDTEIIRLDKKPVEIERINKLRRYLVDTVQNLISNLNQEKDSQKAITIFFNFLVDNGVAGQLEDWRQSAEDAGDLQSAQQPEQLWNLLMQLLQDYLIINSDNFDTNLFFDMLISGFKEATFSQIPSTIDAVNISEIGMVQASNYKQVFIIGATSNDLPKMQKTPGFLSSENLEQLSQFYQEDSYLEDRQTLNNLDQNYQFGLALSLASDQVYVSYPILNASNEELEPSIFYQQLKQNNAPEMNQHDLPADMKQLTSYLTTANASLGYLTYLNTLQKNQALDYILKLTQKKEPKKTKDILLASDFDNQPENISADLAQRLYGNSLNASVSQLETYYQNSFEYFLNYGLKLRKRSENEFDVIQAGNYFHETFDRLVKSLQARKTDLAEIDSLELEKTLTSVRNQMKEEGKYAQLRNDPFNKYLFTCLDKTTSQVASHWQNILKQTPLRAQSSELGFGSGEALTGLDYLIPNMSDNHQVKLRGKIDRLDITEEPNDDRTLAQVIDYKSSAKKFDLGLFYNGISLQMLTYLDVIKKNSKLITGSDKLDLLGAFYQTVTRKNERLNSSKLIDPNLNLKEQIIAEQPNLKYSGLISNDPNLLETAEPELKNPNTGSLIYSGLKTKAKGGFTLPKDKNFSEDELNLLLAYNEYLIKEAAKQILTGKIELNPYRYGKNQTALTYSDYRDIFFFDAMLKNNEYHDIKQLSKKELLTNIKEKLGDD